jgi:hypothetical protein
MKIDLVIPWVCEDENLQKERAKYRTDNTDEQATYQVRFKDNGELRYLLRSVETNASFINKVFLVTNGQIPNWLNLHHPKLQLVNHKEIFPLDALPTFNTLAIEACIPNIPNLSDRFLYANDDMFFANKVNENFFFDKNGYPVIRFRKNYCPEKVSSVLYDVIIKNSLEKFSKKFNIDLPYKENHNIDAYYKPDVLKCIEEFEEEFKKTIYSKFRDKDNIRRIVWSCYSFYIGHSKIKFYNLYKLPNSIRKIAEGIYNLVRDSKILVVDRKKYSVYKHSPIKLFCLNDTETATDTDRERAMNFLAKYFPKKSFFEK